jgi:hypothetical protein
MLNLFSSSTCMKYMQLNVKQITTNQPKHMDRSLSSGNFISYPGRSLPWSYGSWTYNYFMQSVLITTKCVSSNSTCGEVYSIQHYVINFFCDLRQVGGFLRIILPPRYNWNIVESGVKHHLKSYPISSLFWV